MALLSSSSAPPAAPSSELPTPRQAEETKEEEEEDDNIDIDQLEPLESLDITVDRALLERGTSSGGSPERKRKNPPSPGPGGVDGSPVVSESSAMVRNVSDFLADQQLQPEQSETENLPPEQQQSAGPGTSLSTSNAIRTPKPPSGKSLPEDSPLRSSSRKRKFQDEYDPDDDDLMTPRIGDVFSPDSSPSGTGKRTKFDPGQATSSLVEQLRKASRTDCPICLQPWCNVGVHRITAVRCGHLFGKSCIERWLKDRGRCPQCKIKFTRRDLTPLYTNDFAVLNVEERDQALQSMQEAQDQLRQLRDMYRLLQKRYNAVEKRCQFLQAHSKRLNWRTEWQHAKIDKLEAEIVELRAKPSTAAEISNSIPIPSRRQSGTPPAIQEDRTESKAVAQSDDASLKNPSAATEDQKAELAESSSSEEIAEPKTLSLFENLDAILATVCIPETAASAQPPNDADLASSHGSVAEEPEPSVPGSPETQSQLDDSMDAEVLGELDLDAELQAEMEMTHAEDWISDIDLEAILGAEEEPREGEKGEAVADDEESEPPAAEIVLSPNTAHALLSIDF